MKHFKKAMITCLVIFTFSCCVSAEAAKVNPDPYQRIVITLLYKDIRDAVNDYYKGNMRGLDLYKATVSNLEAPSGWAEFNVTVNVESFYGPHNPPYGLECMTFYVSLGEEPKLIKYEHKDIE